MTRANLPSIFAAAFAAFAAGGCLVHDDDKSAGVDEFPNSIYARVNTFLDEGKKSEAISPAPALTGNLVGQAGINVGAGKTAAGKVAAAEAGAASGPLHGLAKLTADSGCTAGNLTVTTPVTLVDKTTKNTFTVCADAKAFDGIDGNEIVIQGKSVTTYATGKVETADVTDADGDGIINPIAGKASKSNIVYTVLDKGTLEKSVLVVGPGPDNKFDTEEDNQIYSITWYRTRGTDTLGYAVYTDADSDGVVLDNGKASVVDLDFYEEGPSKDHPDAVWTRAQMRMVARYGVDAKEVSRVRFEMEDRAGRLETGEILNREGGKDFDMHDTVQAHFLSVGTADSDSLDSMEVRLKMSLGTDFDSKLDDSVYAMDVRTSMKSGEEKSARFAFISDKPIPSGADPAAGALSMEVEYADGTSLTVEGTLSPESMDVRIEDRAGRRLHVVWDRHGKGISLDETK